MKKLLLASSALVVMGGAAYAQDISVSAEAGVAYGDWDGAAAGFTYTAEVTFGLEGSAGDVTYGGEVTVDGVGDEATAGVFYVGTGYGKFSFGADEFDETDAEEGDVKYEGDWGTLGVVAVADVDGDEQFVEVSTSLGDTDVAVSWDNVAGSAVTTLSLDTTLGGFGVGGSFDSESAWDIYASTDMGGVGIKVTYDSDEVAGIELDGEAGSVTWGLSYNTDEETTADLSAAFGDTTVTIAHDSTNAGGTGDDAENIITIEHVVGNLTMHAQANSEGETEIGATATFDF
jgi:hypothetical protein